MGRPLLNRLYSRPRPQPVQTSIEGFLTNSPSTSRRILTIELVFDADAETFHPSWRSRRAQQRSPVRPIRCSWQAGAVYAHPARLPFANASFDEIRCIDQLEFLMREEELLRELARLLAPGGRLTLRVPATGALAGFDSFNLNRYLRDITRHGYVAAEPGEIGWRKHYPTADLTRMMANIGLSVISINRSRFILSELAALSVLIRCFWWRYDVAAYKRGQRRIDRLRGFEDRLRFHGGFLVTVVAAKPEQQQARRDG